MDAYVVRRCLPAEVRDAVEQLWQRNLHLEQRAERKFEWLYEQAPNRPASVFLLEAVASTPGEASSRPSAPPRYVGTAGVGLREIWVANQVLRAGLLADLAVDRAHRTVAPALRLVREVRAWALGELDLAYGFPNQHAQGVFRRIGYQALGAMTRYVRVLRHHAYFGRVRESDLQRLPARIRPLVHRAMSHDGWSGSLAASAFDLLQLGRDLGKVAMARRQHTVTMAAQVPEGVDALWHRCRSEYTVVAVRSERFLSWRYPPAPGRHWVSARQGRRLDAYAIVDRIGDVAHVRDLFGARDGIAALLRQLIFECYRRGATSISMRYLGDPWMVALLQAARFEKRDADRSVFLGISPRLEREQRARLSDPVCWFLTDLDEDV